jgi:ribosomal-protein-alanine N-acetyltransferase
MHSDERCIQYIHHNYLWTKPMVEKRLKEIEQAHKEGTDLYWAISTAQNGPLQGMILLKSIDKEHKSAIVGYMIHPNFWGKGLATTSLKTVVRYGFDMLELNRIEAQVYTEHQPSIKVLEKAGMIREGRLRKNFMISGKARDSFLYSIIRDDYYTNR